MGINPNGRISRKAPRCRPASSTVVPPAVSYSRGDSGAGHRPRGGIDSSRADHHTQTHQRHFYFIWAIRREWRQLRRRLCAQPRVAHRRYHRREWLADPRIRRDEFHIREYFRGNLCVSLQSQSILPLFQSLIIVDLLFVYRVC